LDMRLTKLKIRLFFLLLVIALFITITGGCWDRNEPENRGFVVAAGIDYHEDQKLYEMVVQVADPEALGGGQNGNGSQGPPATIFSAKGHTPFQAARDLTLHTTREPFFSHSELLVISESVARQGLGPVIDFFYRERQTRLITMPIILEEGKSITEFLRTDIPLEQFSAEGLVRQVELSAFERAVFPSRTLSEALIASSLPGREIMIGKAILGEQTEEDMLGEEKEAIRSTVHLEGGAAFSGDKMRGWFDQKQVRGWFWIQGILERGMVIIMCPAHDIHPMGIEIYEVNSTMEPVVTDEGEYRVKLFIQACGRIQDQLCPSGYIWDDKMARSLNQRLAAVVRNEVKDSLERAQELGTDVFGFGNLFYRKKFQEWEKVEDRWEEIFKTLPVDIEIEARVRRAGLIKEPWR